MQTNSSVRVPWGRRFLSWCKDSSSSLKWFTAVPLLFPQSVNVSSAFAFVGVSARAEPPSGEFAGDGVAKTSRGGNFLGVNAGNSHRLRVNSRVPVSMALGGLKIVGFFNLCWVKVLFFSIFLCFVWRMSGSVVGFAVFGTGGCWTHWAGHSWRLMAFDSSA